jgi:hypothetical protein
MSCNKCASENERTFKSEMVLNFHEIENLSREPVYVCEDIVVCLNCGHAEITIPQSGLDRLTASPAKQSKAASRGDS